MSQPTSVSQCLTLGRVYRRWQLYRSAIAAFESALELDPTSASATLEYARLQLQLQALPPALAALDNTLALREDSAPLWDLHAQVLTAMGRLPEALASSERALMLDRRPAYFWLHHATIRRQLGQYGAARRAIETAIAHPVANDELAWQLQLELGAVLECWHDRPKALAAYQAAIDLNPTCYPAWLGQVRMLLARQDGAAALTCCQRAEALAPHDIEVLRLKGRVLEQLQRYDAACAAYRAARARSPHDLTLLWRLREARSRWRRQRLRHFTAWLRRDRWLAQHPS